MKAYEPTCQAYMSIRHIVKKIEIKKFQWKIDEIYKNSVNKFHLEFLSIYKILRMSLFKFAQDQWSMTVKSVNSKQYIFNVLWIFQNELI